MTNEDLENLVSGAKDLIGIFEKHQPITNSSYDIEKVKSCITEMAQKCISDTQECSALLEWMEKHEFFTSPASSKFHGDFKGGLCVHSLQVAYQALKFTEPFFADFMKTKYAANYTFLVQDIFVSAVAHDFCKAGFYSQSYRNTKDIFGNWTKTAYFTVKSSNRTLGHGNESVLLLLESMPSYLNKRPVLEAVSRHMGFSDVTDTEKINYSNFLDNPLVLLLQMADQSSCGWYDY